MLVSRRLLLSAVPLTAALVSPAACSSGTATDPRSPGDPATDGASLVLDTAAWSHDADNDVYYQLGLSYVTAPQDTAYETLSIFVPGAYMSAGDNGDGTFTASVSEGSVGSWTAATAPVVLPVNTPGYAAQKPLTEYSYDTVSAYMQAGIIYVHAGLRGKDSTTDAAAGNAPWGVVDLKAAVRYLRYNATGLPGGAPMWCVKRRRVVSWLVVGRRVCRCGSWRAGSGCGGGPGRGRPGYGVCLGFVCAGSRPG